MRLAVDRMVAAGAATLEASAEAEQRWDDDVQGQLATSAWTSCDSWYRHPVSWRITSNWPGGTDGYVARTRTLAESDFVWG
ncbi:4-hydroxyacetophenone monooxygenase, partial [Rhizobium johnstonii]